MLHQQLNNTIISLYFVALIKTKLMVPTQYIKTKTFKKQLNHHLNALII